MGSHEVITQNTSTHKSSSGTMTQSKGNHMTITSSSFQNNSLMPAKYSCDGEGVNPPLEFSDVPTDAKNLVLLMDDPDVPKNFLPAGVFDHWVIYNMDPSVKEIAEDSTPPGVEGLNGAGQEKYAAACPPDKEHRYFFNLYALDTMLTFSDPSKVNKQMVIDAMQGYIVEQAELMGLYNRPQNK